MREKNIEQKFVKAVKSAGGIAPKLTCPGFDGMPDRLVLMPEGGAVSSVEIHEVPDGGDADETV